MPGISPLIGLDRLPGAQHIGRALHHQVSKYVRVAALELGIDPANHISELKCALLSGDLDMHRDLHQQIAQFFAEPVSVLRIQRSEDLVGFLQEVGSKRLMGLLAIPRAAVRRSQPCDGVLQYRQSPSFGARAARRE